MGLERLDMMSLMVSSNRGASVVVCRGFGSRWWCRRHGMAFYVITAVRFLIKDTHAVHPGTAIYTEF